MKLRRSTLFLIAVLPALLLSAPAVRAEPNAAPDPAGSFEATRPLDTDTNTPNGQTDAAKEAAPASPAPKTLTPDATKAGSLIPTVSTPKDDALFSIPTPEIVRKANLTDFRTFFALVFNIILMFALILFVLLIPIGGVRWMAAAGNEEESTKAKNLLVSAVVGLFITLAAQGMANFVLGTLGVGTKVGWGSWFGSSQPSTSTQGETTAGEKVADGQAAVQLSFVSLSGQPLSSSLQFAVTIDGKQRGTQTASGGRSTIVAPIDAAVTISSVATGLNSPERDLMTFSVLQPVNGVAQVHEIVVADASSTVTLTVSVQNNRPIPSDIGVTARLANRTDQILGNRPITGGTASLPVPADQEIILVVTQGSAQLGTTTVRSPAAGQGSTVHLTLPLTGTGINELPGA